MASNELDASHIRSQSGALGIRATRDRERASIVLARDAVRQVDRAAIEEYAIPGIVLMENAARGLAEAAIDMLDRSVRADATTETAARHVMIVCGGGNNGGDGHALARHLHNAGVTVTTMCLSQPKPDTDAAVNRLIAQRMNIPEIEPANRDSIENARFDLIVDAIFGTGLDREVTGTPREVIEWINDRHEPVLAVDVPSGLNCETGEVHGACVHASMTVTFVALKPAFQQLDVQKLLGEVRVADIGAPRDLIDRLATRLPSPPPGHTDRSRAVSGEAHAVDR